MSTGATVEIAPQAERLEACSPQEILAFAAKSYAPDLAISFSGAEDVVLIDMAAKLEVPVRAFTLDTGRLHAETYEFLEKVRERYQLDLEAFFPRPEAVERLVREKGLFSFYRDGHRECCGVRKVEPLKRALAPLKAWVTGQRRDQSPETRAHLPVMQVDPVFSRPGQPLIKFNPLANWTSQQIWAYIVEHNVPFNSLHQSGYLSIGCAPCTRAVNPGQPERAGRWWWEDPANKECGLHSGNGAASK